MDLTAIVSFQSAGKIKQEEGFKTTHGVCYKQKIWGALIRVFPTRDISLNVRKKCIF